VFKTGCRLSEATEFHQAQPSKRPAKPHADKAYDSDPLRAELRKQGITPRIARRGIELSEQPGRYS
jgi:IS5 family transposase